MCRNVADILKCVAQHSLSLNVRNNPHPTSNVCKIAQNNEMCVFSRNLFFGQYTHHTWAYKIETGRVNISCLRRILCLGCGRVDIYCTIGSHTVGLYFLNKSVLLLEDIFHPSSVSDSVQVHCISNSFAKVAFVYSTLVERNKRCCIV